MAPGQTWWLTPLSQHFGRLRWVDHEVRSSRPARPRWWNPISTKNTKISQAWWQVPVIPDTWEAEAENCLNPGGRGCSELRWCYCTPAWVTEWDSISKKWQNKQTNITNQNTVPRNPHWGFFREVGELQIYNHRSYERRVLRRGLIGFGCVPTQISSWISMFCGKNQWEEIES